MMLWDKNKKSILPHPFDDRLVTARWFTEQATATGLSAGTLFKLCQMIPTTAEWGEVERHPTLPQAGSDRDVVEDVLDR